MTLAWAVIRYGPHVSTDVLRRRARCSKCGALGAALMRTSYVNMAIGDRSFPADLTWPADVAVTQTTAPSV